MNKRYWAIEDQYIVLRVLGEGGFATVYKAYDRMLRKYAAVKKIHSKYTRDPRIMDMFRTEAINTAKLDHVNIVKVINFVTDVHHCYIVMDFVSGTDLEQLLNKCWSTDTSLRPEVALYILSEIFKALKYAHSFKDELTGRSLNFVHQDISPGNMMLYFDGRIKLTDFGIAKAGDSTEGGLAGKLSYLSPEQALGEHIGTQSDLFSMGLVLYEALAGRKAYDGEMKEKLASARAVKIDYKPLKERGVPDGIIHILDKLLKKSTEKRYLSAGEVIEDISDYLSEADPAGSYKKEYKQLISLLMSKEIAAADAEAQEESRINFDLIETTSSPDGSDDGSSGADDQAKPDESQLHDEKEKTMIDFVMDQARHYKKLVLSVLLSATAAFIIFAALDTWLQMTPLGRRIYNRINPPALMLDSIPSGAGIRIIDSRGDDVIEREGYSPVTPTRLSRLSVGAYTVELSHPAMGELVRAMNVTDQAGEPVVSIAGARAEEGHQVIPYEVIVNIDSSPTGASIYLNGRNIGRTPFSGGIELGVYSVRLEREGFGALGAESADAEPAPGVCVIDFSLSGREQGRVDFMFWNIEEGISEGQRYYSIYGSLWKELEVLSSPSGATLTVRGGPDGNYSSTHNTPVEGLMLPSGDYNFRISRSGYAPWTRSIRVDEKTPARIVANMNKLFRVSAVDAETGEEVAADLSLTGPAVVRGIAPMDVSMPSGRARIALSREPEYEPVTLIRDIDEIGDELIVEMSLRDPFLQVEVKDASTGEGISGATVWINDLYWRQTNIFGIARGYIDSGEGKASVEIRGDAFEDKSARVSIGRGERAELSITVGGGSDGLVILEFPSEMLDAEVHINGEYKGRNIDIIENLPLGENLLEIRSESMDNRIRESFTLEGDSPAVSFRVSIENRRGYIRRVDY